MYFITTKRMLEVCFSVHPNIQYRTLKYKLLNLNHYIIRIRPITLPRISTWSVMMGSMASFSGCRR